MAKYGSLTDLIFDLDHEKYCDIEAALEADDLFLAIPDEEEEDLELED